MEQKIITDTDFINCQYSDSRHYDDTEEYNLMYGTLYYSTLPQDISDMYVYNMIALMVIQKQNRILQKVKIKEWKKIIKRVIAKLETFGEDVNVIIPFCNHYNKDIKYTLSSYYLVLGILDELEICNSDKVELIHNIGDVYKEKYGDIETVYPMKSMSALFNQLYEDNPYNEPKWNEIIGLEMIARGIADGVEYILPDDFYRFNGDDFDSEPNDEEPVLDYDAYIYQNANRIITVEKEIEKVETNEIRISDVKRIGVLYYMLKDVLASNQELLIKVANFVVDKDYDTKRKAYNSAYKYIHKPSELINKADKIEYIKKQLERYGIEVPAEL